MKKHLSGIALVTVLLLSMLTTAFAAWQPSKTQQGVIGTEAAVVRSGGAQTGLDIVSEPARDPEGNAEDLSQAETAYIKITPVEQTMKANADHDAISGNGDKAFREKARDRTESGLLYGVNENTNLVYRSAQKADSTTQFLNSVNDRLGWDVESAIQARVEEQKTELETLAAELEAGIKSLEAAGKTQEAAQRQAELDAVRTALETISRPDYAGVENYSPLAVFDVSASAGALELLGDGSSVMIEVELDGVNAKSDLIGIHFFGELDDYESVKERLETDYENTVMEYDHEILDVTVTEEGKVRFRMTHFSPVMILTRVKTADTPVISPVITENPVNQSDSLSWLWILLILLILVIGCCVYRYRKNKKKAAAR